MKHLIYLLPLLFLCSCAGPFGSRSFIGLGASTTVYNANGKPAFTTSGNHTGINFHQTATEVFFSSIVTTHDSATGAQWTGLNQNLDALGNLTTKVGNAWQKAHSIGSLPSVVPSKAINSKP